MTAAGHSGLLKFLLRDTKMSEPTNIESEVPGDHSIRGGGPGNGSIDQTLDPEVQNEMNDVIKKNQAVGDGVEDFTTEPVITITKHEATFSRAGLKLQKVTVTEDISQASSANEEMQNDDESNTREFHGNSNSSGNGYEETKQTRHGEDNEATDSKRTRTKIPMARLRKTVERVKTEMKEKRVPDKGNEPNISYSRKSSIPRLKDSKIPLPKEAATLSDENSTNLNPEEEFDKIFQDISPTDSACLEFVSCNLDNVTQVEMKFEEIIHDYEDNKVNHPITVDKVKHSKIPLLKRKSEHDIEIPVSKIKSTLNKSQSFDTCNNSNTKHCDAQVITKSEITKETSNIYLETKITADKFAVLNDTIISNSYKSDTNGYKIDTSDTNNNIITTVETTSVTTNIGDEHYEINTAGNDSIYKSIPSIDLTETLDDNDVNSTTGLSLNTDELPETVVSKNLNEYVKFDKETVSKIYKIDFTENNFDSIESSLKLNEVTNDTREYSAFNNNYRKELDAGPFSILDVPSADENIVETRPASTKSDSFITKEEIKLNFDTQMNFNALIINKNALVENIDETNEPTEVVTQITSSKEQELTSNKISEAEVKQIKVNEITLFTTDTKEPKEITLKYQFNFDKPISPEANKDPADAVVAKTSTVDLNVFKDDITKKELNKETYKIYSDVFTKLSATQQKDYFSKTERRIDTSNNEQINDRRKDKEFNPDSAKEEDIPILKGKVSRIIRRISSIDSSKPPEKDITDEAPKKKTILTKIAMFEHDDTNEPYPKTKIPNYVYKTSHGQAAQRQTSTELRRPKIVREFLKDSNRQKVIEPTENKTTKHFENARNGEVTSVSQTIENGIKTKSSNDKTLDNRKENYVINDKKTEINYKCVKDVINEIEAKKYAKTSTINVIENGDNKLVKDYDVTKTFDFEQGGIDESKLYGTSDEQQSRVPRSISGEQINNTEPYSYTKIYPNKEVDKTLTAPEYKAAISLNLNDCNTEQEVPGLITAIEYPLPKAHSSEITNEVSFRRFVSNVESLEENLKTQNVDKDSEDGVKGKCRLRREERNMKRAMSTAELDLGNVTRGKVHEMVTRLNAMERYEQRKRDIINCKERPRKSSVSEKIALFEGKLLTVRTEKRQIIQMENQQVSVDVKEEQAKKIEELINAKRTYSAVNAKYIELKDSSKMPTMAIGTALLDKPIARHVVEAAIEMGYRAIDTAYIYGNEKEVGEAINNKISDGTVTREELYIISKLWSTYHRRDLVEVACRRSLTAMGLMYFDLYIIHNPMSFQEGDDPVPKVANVLQYSNSDYMDAWYGIEGLVKKGLVRRGGVSNFNSKQVERVVKRGTLKPVVNQVESHPYLSQVGLAGVCDLYGIKLNCYGVLGSKGTPADLKSDLAPAIDDPLVVVMAAGLEITPAQLLLAYQVNSGRSVVVKSISAARLHENLLAQHLQLNSSHLSALNSLNKNKRIYTFKGLGETHKNYPFNIPF